MKIAVICQYYFPEPFRVHEVCQALAQRGHQVTVLTGVPNYPMGTVPPAYRHGQRRVESLHGVHVLRVGQIPRRPGVVGLALNYVSFVIGACAKMLTLGREFDVVFVYQLSPILMAIPAILLKKRLQKKMLLYCLDLWPDSLAAMGLGPNHLLYKAMGKVSKWCYRQADHIACSSHTFLKHFTESLGIDEKCCSYIPQFADDVFDRIMTAPHDGINLVFAGNIGEMQSVETIVRAASLLKEPKVAWHIAGDGSAYERCRRLAEELGVTERITFHGRLPVERMPELYAMADAMLVTLKNNETISCTLPGKVQSYMASGKAIIGAVHGETARIIADAQCGICCAAEDADGLAKAVSKFIHEADRARYGENARRYYYRHFTAKKHMDAVEQTLNCMMMVRNNESIADQQCLRH